MAGMIDLVKLSERMQQAGFRNVTMSGEFHGTRFHVTGEGRIGLQKLPVLVKVIDRLDPQTAVAVQKEFTELSKKSVSALLGKFFVMCVIADAVEKESLEWLYKTAGEAQEDAKGFVKEGGGNLLVADLPNKAIYPPQARWDTIRFEKKLRDAVQGLM